VPKLSLISSTLKRGRMESVAWGVAAASGLGASERPGLGVRHAPGPALEARGGGLDAPRGPAAFREGQERDAREARAVAVRALGVDHRLPVAALAQPQAVVRQGERRGRPLDEVHARVVLARRGGHERVDGRDAHGPQEERHDDGPEEHAQARAPRGARDHELGRARERQEQRDPRDDRDDGQDAVQGAWRVEQRQRQDGARVHLAREAPHPLDEAMSPVSASTAPAAPAKDWRKRRAM
jgi:hypothetical protein